MGVSGIGVSGVGVSGIGVGSAVISAVGRSASSLPGVAFCSASFPGVATGVVSPPLQPYSGSVPNSPKLHPLSAYRAHIDTALPDTAKSFFRYSDQTPIVPHLRAKA